MAAYPGRIAAAVLFALGTVAVASYTRKTEHFMATSAQCAAAGGAIAFLIGATLIRISAAHSQRLSPNRWWVAAFAFLVGSAFELTPAFQELHAPWGVAVVVILAVDAIALWTIWRRSTRSGWSAGHRCAAAAGALLVYCWCGYRVEVSLHGTSGLRSHSVLVVLALAMLAVTVRRNAGSQG